MKVCKTTTHMKKLKYTFEHLRLKLLEMPPSNMKYLKIFFFIKKMLPAKQDNMFSNATYFKLKYFISVEFHRRHLEKCFLNLKRSVAMNDIQLGKN